VSSAWLRRSDTATRPSNTGRHRTLHVPLHLKFMLPSAQLGSLYASIAGPAASVLLTLRASSFSVRGDQFNVDEVVS